MSWRMAQRCDGRGSRDCAFASSPVEYCLSEKAEPHCRLSFNTGIAAIVTALNFMKAALMFYVAFRVRDEPLVTMGDAVASFLESPDPCTKDMCLLSAREVRKYGYRAGERQWQDKKFRWKDVTSKERSFSTLVLLSLALALVSFLLNRSIIVLENDELRKFSTLVHLGLGAIDPRTAINGVFPNEILTNVLVANSPQVVLSILYFLYNGVFTSFLLSKEWASYAHERKGLRVSQKPSGAQRSTYFLQLPYRFSIPMMILSGTMHWLLSQSIFLIAIDMYDWTGQPGAILTSPFGNYIHYHYKTCGYSPIAIICVLILGGIMVLALVAFGYVPYKRGMPLAGSCSLAISAACHLDGNVDPEGSEAAVEKLMWGVVAYGDDGVGHCSFSTSEVGPPIEGRMYA